MCANKIKIAKKKVDLRRGIDHIGVSANAIIHDGHGKILLQKRGPKARDENGHWDVTGGAIEFGETIEEAIIREIREELCTKPLEIRFLTVYDAHRIHGDNKTHWVAITYIVRVDPKTVRIGEPNKVDELAWFSLNKLPSPMHSQFHKTHQALKDLEIF